MQTLRSYLPVTALAGLLVAASLAPATTEPIRISIAVDAASVRLTPDGEGSRVSVSSAALPPGQWVHARAQGSAELPVRIVHVLLPRGTRARSVRATVGPIKTVATEFQPVLAPEPYNGETPPRNVAPPLAPAPAVRDAARILGTGVWHGRPIADVAVYPFLIEGDRLVVRSRIDVEISVEPAPGPSVSPRRLLPATARSLDAALSAQVVDPAGVSADPLPATAPPGGPFAPTSAPSLEGSPVACVIVTPDILAASYQRLADWRTARGLPTVVRTVEWILAHYRNGSDTQETIRHFIQDAYEKWGTTWVVLGGDVGEVPARMAYSAYYFGGTHIPVDLYYAGLDGTWNDDHDALWGEQPDDHPDLYPEVYVGRLTTSTPDEVDVVTDKIIRYESGVDRAYTDKVLFLAEVLFPAPWSPGDPIYLDGATVVEYVINTSLAGVPPVRITRSYETASSYPGAVQESRQAAIDSMNAGFDHVFHVGHGFRFNMHCADASVVIADADALTNGDRAFNIFMQNCTAVAFDYDCLGEHYLLNPHGGAVSVIGSSNEAFPYTTYPYLQEYARLVFKAGVVHVGEAYARSRLIGTAVAQEGDNADLWTHYTYALLGDPAMEMWTTSVDTFAVAHTDTVPIGTDTLAVDVSVGALPPDSAAVCLWKKDEDYRTVSVDGSGHALVPFSCASPGSVSVVVTGRNHATYVGEIVVVPDAGTHLAFDDAVVDDGSPGTVGNGDGAIDAGETLDLTPLVRNTGGTASAPVTLTLRARSPWVAVIDSTASASSVGAGQSEPGLDAWRIAVDVASPDETACDFDVVIDDGATTWTSSFARLAHAPVLDFTTLRIDDSSLGNGDGVADAGEDVWLFCGLKNFGTGAAFGLSATVTPLSVQTSVFDSSDVYPDVPALGEAENVAGFHLVEVTTLAENPLEIVVTDSFGRSLRDTLELRPPLPPSGIAFDATLGPERLLLSWTASPSIDVDRYIVYHAAVAGGPYTRASVDPVLHTTFTDAGLLPNTRYYFVVAAVDSSGNVSAPSTEASASTNPPQMPGWPNYVPNPSIDSPSVGDLDDDKRNEIVVGNDHLYVWRDDGTELRDGDGQPSTHGVFSSLGVDFTGPEALGRLDYNNGLDVAAAAYTSREVYCFSYTGAVLPGWPQPTINGMRAGVVIGDVDGDGSPEIVAIDEDAYLYAWHVDGTEVRDGDNNAATEGVFRRFPDTPWLQYQMPSLADVDDDGSDEILVATQDSTLYVLNGDGTNVPGWPRALTSFAGGGLAVGDIDGNGQLDIVVPTRDTGDVLALRADNTVLWERWFPQNLDFNPSPALADIDGDGTLEMFLPSSNGKLYAISSTGQDLPGWPVVYSTETFTESSPVIADLTGDGALDIVLGDEGRLIKAWDTSGNMLDGFPLSARDALRGTPSIADIDGDGDVDIVAVGYDGTVFAWDLPAPYDPSLAPWPTFHANLHRNGVYGYQVPTAVGEVTLDYSPHPGGGVTLSWRIPAALGATAASWDIERTVVRGGRRGTFSSVAKGVSTSGDLLEVVDAAALTGEHYVYRLLPEGRAQDAIYSHEVYLAVTRGSLTQNVPNPFNPSTVIAYTVPEGPARRVVLVVYDVSGARVRGLVDGLVPAGRHQSAWDGRDDAGQRVGSGVYFCRIAMPGFTASRKMILLK